MLTSLAEPVLLTCVEERKPLERQRSPGQRGVDRGRELRRDRGAEVALVGEGQQRLPVDRDRGTAPASGRRRSRP